MDYNKILNDYYNLSKITPIKHSNKCAKCNKCIRSIKNDFKERKLCKSCFLKMEEDKRFLDFINFIKKVKY